GLENHPDVGVVGPAAEDTASPHAIQRLEDYILMLTVKVAQLLSITADQHRGATLGKLGSEDFLIAVTEALRLIQNQGALFFRRREAMRAIYTHCQKVDPCA